MCNFEEYDWTEQKESRIKFRQIIAWEQLIVTNNQKNSTVFSKSCFLSYLAIEIWIWRMIRIQYIVSVYKYEQRVTFRRFRGGERGFKKGSTKVPFLSFGSCLLRFLKVCGILFFLHLLVLSKTFSLQT